MADIETDARLEEARKTKNERNILLFKQSMRRSNWIEKKSQKVQADRLLKQNLEDSKANLATSIHPYLNKSYVSKLYKSKVTTKRRWQIEALKVTLQKSGDVRENRNTPYMWKGKNTNDLSSVTSVVNDDLLNLQVDTQKDMLVF